MKIANALYILASLILMVGCGNSDSARKQGGIYGECFKDATCSEGLTCDTEHNVCIKDEKSDAGDQEMSDDDSETSDVDEDAAETDDADATGIWQDPRTGLIWSEKHYLTETPTLDSLIAYCENLVEGGFSDWKMPTIDELRTLIQNCANTEPYGICSISEENGSLEYKDDDEWICDCEWKDEWTQQIGKDEFIYDNGGYYSRLGDNQDVGLCSSSLNSYHNGLWCVTFDIALIGVASPGKVNVVRCVGSYSRQKPCEGLPENAIWNVYSSIPQAWDGSSWQPSDAPSYNEKPSETECRFICNPGYKWDGSKCKLQDIQAINRCSHESTFPCYDSSSGLIWSAKAPDEMFYADAMDYCENLVEGGMGGWHLPTISELRTLIQNCIWTVTGGDCSITDDCLSSTDCDYLHSQCDNDCENLSGSHSIYSKFGDEGDFLSSSKVTDSSYGTVWGVRFDRAQILMFGSDEVYDKGRNVRCVKNVHVPCTGLPENALWNSVSSVWQICGETSCQPGTVGVYNETPSETECRFKCYPGYEWNGSKCTLKNPEALSECGPESPMPCRDSATGLVWSDKPSEMMMFDEAFDYCDNLVEGVISDWRLPTIGELRTLIQNCPATEHGGVCGVTDECLLRDECWVLRDCKCRYGEAAYSKFHSKFMYELISSASKTGQITSGFENVWCVDFSEARIISCSLEYKQTFRCVR